jgi:sulfite exporter TauE/SafE
MLLLSAFILGLVGNFHCLGMCGPIALAIPLKDNSTQTRLLSILIYNVGRIFTYTLLGALIGFIGKGVFLMGFQQKLSIILGAAIILYAIFIIVKRKSSLLNNLLATKFYRLKNAMGSFLRKKTYDANLLLGLLNGLLPCGMIYIALAGALASESVFSSAAFMLFFGLGTLPVMMILPWVATYISSNVRIRLNKIIPYTLLVFGLLLILRGSNLSIPYLSPQVATEQPALIGADIYCH